MHSGSEGDLSASSARSLEVRLSSMTMSSSTTSLTGSPRRGGLSSLPPPSFRRSSEDDVLHHGRRVGSPHDLRSAARRGYPSPIGRSVSSSDDVHRLGASPSSRRALPPPPVRRRDDDAGAFGDRLALAPRTPDAGAVGSARRSSAVSPSPRDDGPDPLFPGLLDDAMPRPSYEDAPSSPFCTPREDASLFESSVLPRAVSDGSSATSSLRGPTSRDRSRATRDDGGAHNANNAYGGRDVGLVGRPSASATARRLHPVHSHAHPPDYPSPPERFGYKSVRPPPHQPPHPHSMLAQPPQPQSQSYPPPPPQNAVGGSGSVRQPPPIRYPHPADYHGLRRPFPPEPQQPPQPQPQPQQHQQPPPVVPYTPERWPVRHCQVSSWPDAPNNYRGPPPPPQPGVSSSSSGCPPPPPSYPPPPYHHHGCPPQQPPPPHLDDHPLHHPHPDHRRASSGSSLDTASDANPQQGYRFGGSGGGARWPPHDAPRRARPPVGGDVLDTDASHFYGGGGPVGPPGRHRHDGGDGAERGGNCFDASKGLLPPSPVPGPGAGAPPKLPPNPVLPYARSRSSFDLSPPEDHQLHPRHPHAHHPDLLLRSAGKVFPGDNRSRSDHDLRHHPSHHHHQRHPSHHSQHSSHHPSPPASVASSHHPHHSHHHHPPPPSNHHHHHHHNSSHHSHNSSHHSHSHRSSSSNHHSSSNTLVYNVKFKRTQRSFVLGPRAPRDVGVGCYVKVEADRGEDLGFVVGRAPKPRAGAGAENDLKRIVRLATHDEVVHLETKRGEEDELLRACRERVDRRRLPMTVRDAEYQFDRNKLTFFFEAEGRVDFRELVRDLFSVYKTRIWMQQLDKNGGPDVDAPPPPPPGEGGEADPSVAAISNGGEAGDRDLVASGATVR